jgi:hypothetical protein
VPVILKYEIREGPAGVHSGAHHDGFIMGFLWLRF